MTDWEKVRVYRCRWCGRRVSGVFGWFHNVDKCKSVRAPLGVKDE